MRRVDRSSRLQYGYGAVDLFSVRSLRIQPSDVHPSRKRLAGADRDRISPAPPERAARARRPSAPPERAARARDPSAPPERAARARRPSAPPERAARARRPSAPPERAARALAALVEADNDVGVLS